MSVFGFLLVGLLGLLSAVKDGSEISTGLLDKETGLKYSQRGFEALVFASARSIPHLKTRTSEDTVYNHELGRSEAVGSSIALDFTAFAFCEYTGPVDAHFALAIIGEWGFRWRS